MRSVSGNIRFVRSYLLASFGHVQNFEQTPLDKYVQGMSVGMQFVRFLAFCPVLMRSVSCMYPLMSVRPEF